jgi:hypothetical protein
VIFRERLFSFRMIALTAESSAISHRELNHVNEGTGG